MPHNETFTQVLNETQEAALNLPDIINRRNATTNFIHESVFNDGFMTLEVSCLFFTDDAEHKHIHTLTSSVKGCRSRLTMDAERDDDVIKLC